MKKQLVMMAAALALLVSTAVYASAQAPEPGEGMPEEHEGWQKEPPPDMDEEMGVQREVIIRKQGNRFGGEGGMQGKKFGGEGARQGKKFGGDAGFMDDLKVCGTIKKHDPKFAETLSDLRESAPAEYKMTINVARKLLNMAAKENDEKIEADMVREIALEYDTKKLSRKYEKASDADKAAIKADLKAKLGELFDLKQKSQQVRVQRMERELAQLKKKLETRKASKDKIVQERLSQMTGEGFGW